jgi:hypothetical protein
MIDWLFKLINFIRIRYNDWFYKQQVAKIKPFTDLMQDYYDVRHEEVIRSTKIANDRRLCGDIYHKATLLFIKHNPGNTASDFDNLSPGMREVYLMAVEGD